MAQFVAFDSAVQVSGVVIRSFIEAMGDKALPILAEFGLGDANPNKWYSQQAWLDAFHELSLGDFSATLDLVSVGMRIPEVAVWPSDIETVEDALYSIDKAYQMAHRNGDIGSYRVTHVGQQEVELVCDNPYPCNFDYGIIYSTARLFLPARSGLSVVHDDHAPCRNHGDDSCTYYVRW